jgi:hypothetical protein
MAHYAPEDGLGVTAHAHKSQLSSHEEMAVDLNRTAFGTGPKGIRLALPYCTDFVVVNHFDSSSGEYTGRQQPKRDLIRLKILAS